MRHVTRLLATLALTVGLLATSSVGPLSAATADPSRGASPSADGSASAGSSANASRSASSTPSKSSPSSSTKKSPSTRKSTVRRQAASSDDPNLVTTITSQPDYYSTNREPKFEYKVSSPTPLLAATVKFRCKITGPGRSGNVRDDCGTDTVQPDANTVTGSFTFQDGNKIAPAAHKFTFSVRAYTTAPVTNDQTFGTQDTYSWHVYSWYSPRKYIPATGASFNNPLSSKAAGRKSLTRVIRTIASMPGYREAAQSGGQCPSRDGDPAVPSEIRISLYSMTDGAFTNAMRAASHRCVSVQILMNNHLTPGNDPAWRRLVNALGGTRRLGNGTWRRSFAHRCNYACRGGGVLHTKMYLFNPRQVAMDAHQDRFRNVTMVGSSNMTSNASAIQWNDLYGVRNDAQLFSTFRQEFTLMRLDNGYHRRTYKGFSDDGGKYNTVFWPVTKGHDPEMAALKSIHCSGATGGTGIHGHTLVHINMHAWFGLRGLAFQRQVRSLYAKGCYVRILYSFMTKRVWYRLKHGTNGRMELRRTIFSLDGNRYADVYSHYKNILVSGHWANDTNAKIVWTGSNNFTPDGTNFDEVMIRIRSAAAWNQYRNQWNYMKRRKSSATYASFLEPVGGGRAPKTGAGFTATDTPTILSPDVTRAPDGTPRALD